MIWRCVCGEAPEFAARHCRRCRRPLGFDPQNGQMRALEEGDKNRRCANGVRLCNWLAVAPGELCFSCRLTRRIPPQTSVDARRAHRRFEGAKRRLIAALLRLGLLPRYAETADGRRLEINLLQDQRDNPAVADEFVLTGHANGVIVINMREADRSHVEETRRHFREKYRTLLGSLRHESGHYFWGALIAPEQSRREQFRARFGDERADYQNALDNYHRAPPGEHRDFVSAYARMHPHEDWAETWAHYLHMEDALATAAGAGMMFPRQIGDDFDDMLACWRRLAAVANALAAALGHRRAYPFQPDAQAVEKLRFIHHAVRAAAQ